MPNYVTCGLHRELELISINHLLYLKKRKNVSLRKTGKNNLKEKIRDDVLWEFVRVSGRHETKARKIN